MADNEIVKETAQEEETAQTAACQENESTCEAPAEEADCDGEITACDGGEMTAPKKKDAKEALKKLITPRNTVIAAAAVVAVILVIIFAGAGKTQATKDVISMIRDMPEIGMNSGDELDRIDAAYNALSEKEQKRVSNYSRYERAREKYDEINGFNLDILRVTDAAATDFSGTNFNIDELIALGNSLLDEYGKMSDKRKAEVVPEIKDIELALETLAVYNDAATSAAAVYCKAFLETYKANSYDITDIGCILEVRPGGVLYTMFGITVTKDGGETTKNYYSHARTSTDTKETLLLRQPDIFFADTPYSDKSVEYNAIDNSNIKISVDKVMEKVNAAE